MMGACPPLTGAFFFILNCFTLCGVVGCGRRTHWFHTIIMSRTELDRVFNNTAMKKRCVVPRYFSGLEEYDEC